MEISCIFLYIINKYTTAVQIIVKLYKSKKMSFFFNTTTSYSELSSFSEELGKGIGGFVGWEESR